MICLHHEHSTDSCFGIDQQRSICSMGGCKRRHHPSLLSAPQGSVQAVQAAGHLLVGDGGGLNPGVSVVGETEINVTESVLGTSVDSHVHFELGASRFCLDQTCLFLLTAVFPRTSQHVASLYQELLLSHGS